MNIEDKDVELLHKIKSADDDIKEGKHLANFLSTTMYKKAEKYFIKCRTNIDYQPYIELALKKSNLYGNSQFKDADHEIKRKILRVVAEAIEFYKKKELLKEIIDN